MERTCLGCMAYVLRELGDWERAAALAGDLRTPGASPDATLVADGSLGAILAFRGEWDAARPLLARCLDTAIRLDVVSMGVDSAAALAMLEEHEGDIGQASAHCRFLLERWQRSEDRHYAVWGLRWASCFFARHGALAEARGCADALSKISAATGHADALAALAHTLGETALAEGDAETAAQQIERASELHATLEIPFERAQIQLRAGVALSAAGQHEVAIQRGGGAPHGAQAWGGPARRCCGGRDRAARRVGRADLGRRAAADHDHAGLSRRELEVMRLVASGHTNREIAGPARAQHPHRRHARPNILAKLRCRSRAEAAAKAGELGLLPQP